MRSQAERQPCLKPLQREGKLAFNAELKHSANSQDKGDWTLISAQGRRMNLPLPPTMLLSNRYDALGLEDDRVSNGQDLGKASCAELIQPSTCIRASPPRKVCRVLVIGVFSLRGPKVRICHADSLSREVCLPGACIRDVMESLPSLMKPADYHPFLLF